MERAPRAKFDMGHKSPTIQKHRNKQQHNIRPIPQVTSRSFDIPEIGLCLGELEFDTRITRRYTGLITITRALKRLYLSHESSFHTPVELISVCAWLKG